jgi:dihydrofolate synthase/folylpolyglutamate synthase
VACAVAAAEGALGHALDEGAAHRALGAVTFPGRFELVRADPPVVLDGAHNPQAAEVLAGAIREAFSGEKPVILLGVLADKDVTGIVRALIDVAAGFVAARNSSHRTLLAHDLAQVVERLTGTCPPAEEDLGRAIETAVRLAGPAGVVVTGSLYTVGEARTLLRG